MGVSIKTIVSHIPKYVLRQYFEIHQIIFDELIDWERPDKEVTRVVEKAIHRLHKTKYDFIHAHLERIHLVAGERGIKALINASDQPAEMTEKLQAMDNSHHRAMAIFLEDHALFKIAEEILFVDFKTEGRSWQHYSINTDETVDDITEDDANDFAFEVAKIIRHNFNNRAECCGEIYQRYADGTRQISVYVNDLPNSDMHVKDHQLHRVNTQKAIVAAIVYDPHGRQICTVIEGGKSNHDLMRQAFAEVFLKQKNPAFTRTEPVYFAIEKFARRPQAPLLATKPAHNIKVIRVRRLDIIASQPFDHVMTVDTPPGDKNLDLYSLRTFFDEAGVLYGKYGLSQVVLSFHFHPKKAGGRGKTIRLSLKKDSSDLKNLNEDDRRIIEEYLKQWGILGMPQAKQLLITERAAEAEYV